MAFSQSEERQRHDDRDGSITRRFVVLRHELPDTAARPSHWDLMLEVPGALRTWALEAPPALGTTTWADALPDHRLAYLDYEGPVSGNRGEVHRFDHGTFEWIQDNAHSVVVRLQGERFQGIVRCDKQEKRWRVAFLPLNASTTSQSLQ